MSVSCEDIPNLYNETKTKCWKDVGQAYAAAQSSEALRPEAEAAGDSVFSWVVKAAIVFGVITLLFVIAYRLTDGFTHFVSGARGHRRY